VDKIEGGYGLWSILPVQSGAMSLIEYYDRACVILNVTGGMIIGIPSNAKAASDDELRELLVARPDIYGVHILGAAGGLRGKARLAVLRSVGYDGEVSLDANRVSTWWNKWCPNRSEARARLLAGLPPKTRLTEGEPWPMAA
jgi:hypothetical protein